LVNRPHDQSQNCFFPAWLGLVWFGLAKKNREALDPGWQFFPTAGFIAAVLVFGIPHHFLFVTRKKKGKHRLFGFTAFWSLLLGHGAFLGFCCFTCFLEKQQISKTASGMLSVLLNVLFISKDINQNI